MNWSEEHIKELAELEEHVKNNTKRIDTHDKKIEDLSKVYVALTEVKSETKQMNVKVDRIETDVREIKEKPAQKVEEIKMVIITGIVSAIVGFILGQIGL